MSEDCIFCQQENLEIIKSGENVFAVRDTSPVTKGHTLIIPKSHRTDFFDMNAEERMESLQFLDEIKSDLESKDLSITGFNIGLNCGASAGQTIFHCHMHLIPRRENDTSSPRGGVRGVIPEKQSY